MQKGIGKGANAFHSTVLIQWYELCQWVWKKINSFETVDDLVTLKLEPVSSQQILPPFCLWNHHCMTPSCSPFTSPLLLLSSASSPSFFLNYTFCHFYPSIHSSTAPPSSSLVLPPESRAAIRSILIEVSWGQAIHSCFTIKCEQRRETEEKTWGWWERVQQAVCLGFLMCIYCKMAMFF